MIQNLINAIPLVFNLEAILAILGGSAVGIIIGAIPGLGAVVGMSVFLPLTFTMSPTAAVALLVAIYKGTMLGGSFSAILINTPGTPAAAATCLDGRPLSEKGLSKKATQATIFSSGLADSISDVFLIVFSVIVARVVLQFRSPEMFWIMLFALLITGGLAGKSLWKGILSVSIGALIGSIGMDPLAGTPRLAITSTIGRLEGLDLVAVLLGAFAFSEMLIFVMKKIDKSQRITGKIYGPSLNFSDVRKCLKAFFIGTGMGTGIGVIPGIGSTAGAFLSYGITKQAYGGKYDGVKFGEGALPGVVSAEAGNNAVAGSNMLPLLTLGIPGSASAALLLAALMLQGVSPGPRIFIEHGEVVYGIFLALLVANVANILLAHILIKPIIRILKSDPNILFPIIMVICFAGAYSVNRRFLDLGVMVAIGILSFLMRKVNIPIAPMLIAFILANPLERYFRISLSISEGDYSIFLASQINKAMILVVLLTLLVLIIQRAKKMF